MSILEDQVLLHDTEVT